MLGRCQRHQGRGDSDFRIRRPKKVITSQAPPSQCEVAVMKFRGSWGVVRREGMHLGLQALLGSCVPKMEPRCCCLP